MDTNGDSVEKRSEEKFDDGLDTDIGKGDAVVTEKSLFSRAPKGGTVDNDSRESFYKPIDSFEGLHRWDPHFEWEPKEEQRVVRKVGLPYPAHCPGPLRLVHNVTISKDSDHFCRSTGESCLSFA